MTAPMLPHIDDVLSRCLRCGLCLPVCPTYELTHDERSSPRGRIRLIRALHDGSAELSAETPEEMYFCLDCQACETACPAGVQYGVLVEDARNRIAQEGQEPRAVRWAKRILLRGILASKRRTAAFGALLRLYQRSGLQDAVDVSGILTLFSETLALRHRLLPRVTEAPFDRQAGGLAPAAGARRGNVALLTGCVMNFAFPEVHRDTVEVLQRNGYDVAIPREQVCCGALHGHYGDRAGAQRLAEANVRVFADPGIDAVVVNAAGCSAFMKHSGTLLESDGEAAAVGAKVFEATEFLVRGGFARPAHALGLRVTYHEPCHLVHAQKISRQPREVLEAIPGLEFVELPEATWCCGSAGMYNAIHATEAAALLTRKLENVATTSAVVVATGNPGCHLQLRQGLAARGDLTEVAHPLSLLARAYRGS
jgi:glycolate oxidase iron-sulfur subunit